MPRISQKTVAIILTADGTAFAFFGAGLTLGVYAIDAKIQMDCAYTVINTRSKHPHDVIFGPMLSNVRVRCCEHV